VEALVRQQRSGTLEPGDAGSVSRQSTERSTPRGAVVGSSKVIQSTKAAMFSAAAILLVGVLVAGWMMRPETLDGPCAVANGPAMVPELTESSGLAVSRRTPGLLWSHNDSGNDAVLFAIDPAGTVHGRVRLPVRTRDWEDISAAPCLSDDCLYIADIGDNRAARHTIQIYRVPEPAPGDAQTAPPDVFNATYADGPHNAEAMFVIGADLFIVTRDRSGWVYRSRVPPAGGGNLRFERVGHLGLQGVTDAETSPDGATVVVRTSREAALYRASDVIRDSFMPYLRMSIEALQEPQGEGVALDGDMLYLSSEGRPWNRAGRIVRLRCSF
jgi:hypothetical protein